MAIASAFLTFALCLLPFALPSAEQQQRDVARPLNGTAVLSGTVMTDEANSRPVRRAIVTIFPPGENANQRITATDDVGRFEFGGLPAGNVTLYVSKPSYVTTYYGAKRPGATVGVPIALAEGQRAAVTVRLLRGAVITGAIVDEAGQPASSVPVRLQRVTVSTTGERSVAAFSVPSGPGGAASDDRGVYRIFGLPSGDYLVSAQPRPASPLALLTGSGAGELRQATDAELQWAERQIQGVASSGPDVAAPPAGAAVAYANVFYPGTADAGAATAVTVTAGQERAGIDIRLLFVATARVEGSVIGPNGQPAAGVQVSLLQKTPANDDVSRLAELVAVGLAAPSPASRTLADGTFSIQGVEPGHYALMARAGGAPAGRSVAGPPAEALWALTDVDVDGHDVAGIALTLAVGMTVSGRVVFEGTTLQAPSDLSRASIRVTPAQNGPGAVMSQAAANLVAAGLASVRDSAAAVEGRVFSVPGVVPGRYRIAATVPAWTLKSVMLGDRDVADVAFEIKPGENVSDVVVTFTDSPAAVSGILYDGAGRPTSDFSIILFSADKSLWFQGSRRLRSPARPASDGRFQFTGLPPGDYYLAALTDFAPNDWFNPQFLDQVMSAAVKVTLGPGEQKKQDLRIGK